MNEEAARPLLTKPLTTIVMSLDPRYLSRVTRYLEGLQCTVRQEGEGYRVIFPEGTVEEVYMGQSTQWTTRTTVRLPAGTTLTKLVSHPLNETQTQRTLLAFPKALLDAPLDEEAARG